ncbi:hypothetical protein G7046_g9670 [Stylonectria norvegica]|nr:hypothetical protein G7046_g9670 [Stylonectria norvegica]
MGREAGGDFSLGVFDGGLDVVLVGRREGDALLGQAVQGAAGLALAHALVQAHELGVVVRRGRIEAGEGGVGALGAGRRRGADAVVEVAGDEEV